MARTDGGPLLATTSVDGTALSHRGRLAAWAFLGALLVLAYWNLVTWDPLDGVRRPAEGAERIFFQPSAERPLLLLALTFYFVGQRMGRLGAIMASRGSPVIGAAFLSTSLAVAAWAHYVDAPDLLVPSLQLLLIGGAALRAGFPGVRVMRLPVLFLFLAWPIPPPLQNAIVYPLQLFTADVSEWILELLGYTAVAFGDRVYTPWGRFHVIETCAGLRTIQILMMASVVYSDVFHRSFGRAVLLFLAAPIVGTVVNLLRVQSIIFSPYADIAAAHTTQGIVMTCLGVIALAGVDRVAESWKQSTPPEVPSSVPILEAPLSPAFGVLAGLLVVIALVPYALPAWSPADTETAASIRTVAPKLDEWRSNGVPTDTGFLGSVGFSDRTQRVYTRGSDESVENITVFVGEDDRLNRRGSMASAKTAYPGTGFDLVDAAPVRLAATTAHLMLFSSIQGDRLVLYWRDGIEPVLIEAGRSVIGLDRSPLRRPRPATVWRFETDVGDDPVAARDRLVAFAPALYATWGGHSSTDRE